MQGMATYFHHNDMPHAVLQDHHYDVIYSTLTPPTAGVLLTDRPVSGDPALPSGGILTVDTDLDLADYRISDAPAEYARWIVPAEVLNTHAITRFQS